MRISVEVINERKNVGTIYHFTSIEGIINILEDNKMKLTVGRDFGYFSTTRDKRFLSRANWTVENSLVAGLVLDGSRLSDNLRIVPHNYWYDEYYDEIDSTGDESRDDYKHSDIKMSGKDEMEERVLVPDRYNSSGYFKNILKFTDSILVGKDNFFEWVENSSDRDIEKLFNWIYEGKFKFTFRDDVMGYDLEGKFVPEDEIREFMKEDYKEIWEDFLGIYNLKVKFI